MICTYLKNELCSLTGDKTTPLRCTSLCGEDYSRILNMLSLVLKAKQNRVQRDKLGLNPPETFPPQRSPIQKPELPQEEIENLKSICKVCDEVETCRKCPTCGGKRVLVWPRFTNEICPRGKWSLDVTAIILVGPTERLDHVQMTVNSLRENAEGPLDILLVLDGPNPHRVALLSMETEHIQCLELPETRGERAALNRGVSMCKTRYFLRIDAHCTMSKGWDSQLKRALKHDNDLAFCTIVGLNPADLSVNPGQYTRVYLMDNMEEKWWTPGVEGKPIVPSPCLTGCGWMMSVRGFIQTVGPVDETLAKWGAIGPEMAVRIRRAKGNLWLVRGVTCGHIFGTNKKGYPVADLKRTRESLLAEYAAELKSIQSEFGPR